MLVVILDVERKRTHGLLPVVCSVIETEDNRPFR